MLEIRHCDISKNFPCRFSFWFKKIQNQNNIKNFLFRYDFLKEPREFQD